MPPQKLKIELPYDPVIPLLGIYTKSIEGRSQRDTYTPMVTVALFSIAKTWKQPKCGLSMQWNIIQP